MGRKLSNLAPDRAALANEARQLLAAVRTAYLGTLADRDGQPMPFVSLVETRLAPESELILLLSDLSDHSKHLKANIRASILIDGTEGLAQPLAGPRLTLLGEVGRSEQAASDKALFLERFPGAALYADFGDFNFYRFRIREGYFVAGFGRVLRMDAADLK